MDNLPDFSSGDYEENLQEQRDEIFALQSIFNTEGDEQLKLLSEVSEDSSGHFTLLVKVSPKPIAEKISVNVALPVSSITDKDDSGAEGACAAPPVADITSEPPRLSSDVRLHRSISGRQWKGSFKVKYLSPLHLVTSFPSSYPSHNPPVIHLSCDWATNLQLQVLEQALLDHWSTAGHMPVVFTWVDWLENESLRYLGVSDQITLGSDQSCVMDEALWEDGIGETIASMIRYNQEKSDEEFCQSTHLCEICYDEYPGTQFFKLNECSHAFCHTCVHDFCELHVTAGTVEELRCPIPKCNSIVPPHIIQSVLPEEAYVRWEQLMLQKTLDAMEDTVYCPRCASVVIAEEDKESCLAHCTFCYFAFCTECQRGWHQGRNCETDEDVFEQLQKKDTDRMTTAVRERFEILRQRMEEDIKNKVLKNNLTKPCPSCKIPVEKIGGCNKMTCKCGAMFCWICGKSINGYSHFRSAGCVLFPGQTAPPPIGAIVRRRPDAFLRIQAMIEVDPRMVNRQSRCPMCKQNNLKGNDGNNHIKCWNCKSNFCFMCKQRIIGLVREHFAGTCNQHS